MTEPLHLYRDSLQVGLQVGAFIPESETNQEPFHFFATVQRQSRDRFKLACSGRHIPSSYKKENSQPGTRIIISIDDRDPVLILDTKILMSSYRPEVIGLDADCLEFWVPINEQTDIQVTKRSFVRIPITVPVQLMSYSNPQESSDLGYSIDMSAGGISFFHHSEVEPKVEIELQLFLTPQQAPLLLKARVLRCLQASLHTEQNYKISAEFIHLDSNVEAKLMKECYRVQLARAGD